MSVRSSRFWWGALAVAGVAMVAAPVAVWAQTPAGTQTFVGYNLAAEANGVAVLFGNPDSQPYPVAAAQVPQTSATFATGPSAYALSSLAWPGPLAANAGSLSGLLLPLCVPDGNGVCLPKPDTQTQNLANYPVRAEASYPGGKPQDSAGPMASAAGDRFSDARASVSDFASPGIVSVGRVTTHSRTELVEGRVVATAESVLSDVVLAGGVVKIAALRTVARVTSDGGQASVDRDVTVQGLEVAGQPASITEQGLRVGTTSGENPVGGLVTAANEALLDRMGITLSLTRTVEDRPGTGAANVTTGALTMVWDLGGSGYFATVTLGGASARAQATTGDDQPVEEPAPETGSPDVVPPVAGVPGDGLGGVPALGPGTPTVPVTAGRDGRGSRSATLPPGEEALARPAAYAHAPGAGWVAMALTGALAGGLGMSRLRRLALAGTSGAGSCPLEGRNA